MGFCKKILFEFMNRSVTVVFLFACFIALIYGCKRHEVEASKLPENTFTIKGSVREMELYPDPPPAFPEHEGRAEFLSYCAICHSLKYISGQPAFPAKVWDAEVHKMIAKYHAPIDSATAKKIVDYLVAVKGK